MSTPHLLIGATGQVGAQLAARLAAAGAGVAATGRRTPAAMPLNLADARQVADVLDQVRPETVWLAGAYTHVDGCEAHPEVSHQVNVAGPLAVAAWVRAHGGRLVFFSTDYVFDGSAGPYGEEASPHPLSVYGRDKRSVELALLADVPGQTLVVRTTSVYGFATCGQGFIERLAESLRAGRPVRLPRDQWGSPTSAANLAEATYRLWSAGATGIWHVAGPDYLTRDAWGRAVAAHFGLNPALVEGVPTAALAQAAPRPLAGGLVSARAEAFLHMNFWDAATGLAHLAAPVGWDPHSPSRT